MGIAWHCLDLGIYWNFRQRDILIIRSFGVLANTHCFFWRRVFCIALQKKCPYSIATMVFFVNCRTHHCRSLGGFFHLNQVIQYLHCLDSVEHQCDFHSHSCSIYPWWAHQEVGGCDGWYWNHWLGSYFSF